MIYYSMMGRRPNELNAIYIDPTSVTNGAGTISDPRNTLVGLTITDNYTYLFRRGTTYTTSVELNLSNRTGVIFASYDVGLIPKYHFTGTGTCAVRFAGSTNCAFTTIELYTNLSQSVVTLIQLGFVEGNDGGTGNIIAGCQIHDVKQGVEVGGIGIRGGGVDLSIVNCEIYNCGEDGIYAAFTTNLLISNCNIHHVNQNYAGAAIGFLSIGNLAGGDSVQLDGRWINCSIKDTIMDRTDIYTGNKFALILGGAVGPTIFNDAIVEHCTFKVRSGANITYCVYAGQGNGVIFRYNRFEGLTSGLRLISPYCINFKIHHNIFSDCAGSMALINSGGYPQDTLIYNNVFVRGSVYAHVSIYGGHLELKNNIFDNSFTAFSATGSATYLKENNCYQDPTKIGTGGLETGGVTGDPLFVDPITNDFHLQVGSPCIGTGVNVGILEDFEGDTTPTLNMGIYF